MIDPADADMTVALFADALADAVDSSTALREWSTRYPELADEFAVMAAERQFGDRGVDAPAVASQAELMSRLARHASKAAKAAKASAEPKTMPKAGGSVDIAGAAAAVGLAYPDDLAHRLRLPPSILERIVSRSIPARTLPSVLVDQMAGVLASARVDVLGWLGVAQSRSAYAAVVSEEKAAYGTPSTFAETIANAADVDDADRAYWASVIGVSRVVGEE